MSGIQPCTLLFGALILIFSGSHAKSQVERASNDAGFWRVYWYEKGEEHANPYFNNRQLRVNAPESVLHPTFGDRSEVRSPGTMRIRTEVDLRTLRRADLYLEIWGGHPGTANKRFSINGRSDYKIPEVGTATGNCTHQYPAFGLSLTDLVRGYNTVQFACDTGDTFWGHYIVDNAALLLGLKHGDTQLIDGGLDGFDPEIQLEYRPNPEHIRLQLIVDSEFANQISAVHYQGHYYGYDENGDGRTTDWHGMTKNRVPYGMLGTATEPPFRLEWDTSMIPAQQDIRVRVWIEWKHDPNLLFLTKAKETVSIPKRRSEQIDIFRAQDLPAPFWSRAGNENACHIHLPFDPTTIRSAALHVVSWTGGAGTVKNYFTVNDQFIPVAEGSAHEVNYSVHTVEPHWLRKGNNRIRLLSDTDHHGIEILLPGPALVILHRD